jgi:Trp operon repressor
MVNVSKNKLKRDIHVRIDKEFVRLLASTKTKRATAQLLNELLTDAERTVLIKRLAIIVMLSRDHSIYEVQHALKVSPATVAKFQKNLRAGRTPHLKRLFGVDPRQQKELIDLVEAILYAGMPPFDGKGRRKWVEKMRSNK